MRLRKTITLSLILVLALQLLPVKQAVRYFFVDNPVVEELLHTSKNATKNFRMLDEDHFLWDGDEYAPRFFVVMNEDFFHHAESLPVSHSADIHVPPPNFS